MKSTLTESFEVGDLEQILKPWVHVDEYQSQSGRDDKFCVITFAIDDELAAKDLSDFLIRGYDFVSSSDTSTGEISTGRYLVFAEIRRLTTIFDHLQEILKDLEAACGIKSTAWRFKYRKQKDYSPLTKENFNNIVPLTSRAYRKQYEDSLNTLRSAAGIPAKTTEPVSSELKSIQNLAGIK